MSAQEAIEEVTAVAAWVAQPAHGRSRRLTNSVIHEGFSMLRRLVSVLVAVVMACVSAFVRADDNPLLGTWQLKSFVRQTSATGERYNQLGEHPDGYISYSADGRMLVFFVAGDQPRPRSEPTDEERIRLHKSMLAYGGRYDVSPP